MANSGFRENAAYMIGSDGHAASHHANSASNPGIPQILVRVIIPHGKSRV